MAFSFIQFPFRFSIAGLQQDYKTCEEFGFQLHHNTKDFTGDWTCLSLRSVDGTISNPHAFSIHGTYINTPLLKECPTIENVMSHFHCDWETIRLLKLDPGSVIHEHSDDGLGYEDGRFRIHVPILTNDDVEFVLDGKKVVMKEGECWYGNFNKPHSVANHGSTPRVHLVMDAIRNDWSDQLFKELGYDFEAEHQLPVYDEATKLQMIAHLQEMDTPVAKALIQQLKGQA
tara:strand:+ start:634 stop:1323 length:690 start_codon:yes stop_codon:yes gene_type:complete